MPQDRAPARPTLERVPVSALRGVGPQLGARLATLGIRSVADVLFHLPLRYQDRTRIVPIGALRPGIEVLVAGRVLEVRVESGRRRSLVCLLGDPSGVITLRFYHFSAAQQRNLNSATRLLCFGEARRGRNGIEIYHPEYRVLTDEADSGAEPGLTPIYPSTEGLHQSSWRSLTSQALQMLDDGGLAELLPAGFHTAAVPLATALRYLHRPPPDAPVAQLMAGTHPYQQRLATEELLAHQLGLLLIRQRARTQDAPVLRDDRRLGGRLLENLAFRPTAAQMRVSEEIHSDLVSGRPMLRLVQGDVGCGKTLVAALAALTTIGAGWQVAIMAPTELLAEQHQRSFSAWLEPLGLRCVLLGGRVSAQARRAAIGGIADGTIHLAGGTHALFQEQVRFFRLGLVIIDEQHRFGVHQRLALRDKGTDDGVAPHQLVMTATPIPRTLAMTVYADLDHSLIDELPPGRTPVTTAVLANTRRAEVVERVRAACAEGRQAYWVCTLIEESETLQAQAAAATASELAAQLPQVRVGLVHGRVLTRERLATMDAFKRGEIELLVATTVIEVGVDVPRASLMIIENAERLGLAQLHQLRGRVGRGSIASHCVLLYQPPLSHPGRARLEAMRDTSDGFVLAERDLALRGPGELLGTRQTGLMGLRFADPVRDAALLPAVRSAATQLLEYHAELVAPLLERWIPGRTRYAEA
ncbi:MAG TPA: ATP-dependent DNA helicase RecG [Pseudomonadales bacterium]|nr:ATP-dependent DNA helicase RecG [Pseudomonadales bacterium]